jgi:hypothetical protein
MSTMEQSRVFVQAILWIASTMAVVLAAWRLATRLDPQAGSFKVVHTIVVAWSWLVVAAVALGTGRILSGTSLLIAVPVVGLATLAVFDHARNRWRKGSSEAEDAAEPAPPRSAWSTAVWAVIVTLSAARIIARGLLEFSTNYDSLMYHMPMVDYWLQAGSLHIPDSSHWPNPGGNELLGLWAVAPFPGDFLFVLDNIPATILLALGARELGALLGLAPGLRNLAAVAIVSNVVVVYHLTNAENDVAVAGLFLACACYGLRFARHGRAADLVLGALSLGLLCGIKYYALGYAAVVWCAASLLSARCRGMRAGLRVALAWALGAILLGGYWYARNAIASGSPLYPLVLSSDTGAPQTDYPEPWRTTFVGNGRPEIGLLTAKAIWRMSGPSYLAAVLLVPTTLAWLVASGIRSSRWEGPEASGPERLALAFLILGSGDVFAVTPMALEDVPGTLNQLHWGYTPFRYGLSFLGLAVLGLTLLLQDVCGRSRLRAGRMSLLTYLPHAFLFGSAIYQLAFLFGEDRSEVHWLVDLLICTAGFGAFFVSYVLMKQRTHSWRRIVLALACAAAVGIAWLAEAWDAQFAGFYNAMYSTRVFSKTRALDPPPIRIALFDYRCHPFFGARRQFRVCQPRPEPSSGWLTRYLCDRGVSHVVTRSHESDTMPRWDAYREMSRWVARNPRYFELLHSDREFSLYRVLPAVCSAGDRPPETSVSR